jgi:CRISPR type IV-associated protein Csf3
MIANWKVTALLLSPLANNPPNLDSLLMREVALKSHESAEKLTRDTRLKDIKAPFIPIERRGINGKYIFCCSNPIMPFPYADYNAHLTKRFETDRVARLLAPEHRTKILNSSGPYKMRNETARIRMIKRIAWFVRGDRDNIINITKRIPALGKYIRIGYGLVNEWEFEEMQEDYSLFAGDGKVLMKTMPLGRHLDGVQKDSYRISYGGAYPPYWHPENYEKIAVPC